jgi:iron complex outermembrane receptor protein
MKAGILHTFVMTVENVMNREYRMHLSRVKSIMPEPGRNLKLYYRLYF